MRASIWPLLAMLLISVATDAYIWVQSRRRCRSIEWSRLQLATSLLLWLFIIAMVALPARRGSNWQLLSKMWLLFVWVSVYFPKLFAVVADLLAAIPTLFHRRRLRRLTKAGIVCAFAGCAIMWWGALINRYHIQVRQAEVPVVNLPESFDGMRIAHFSDLHTGTFGTDTAFVSLLVDSINGLQPDAIMFTGDIVNRRTDEIRPFVPVLRRLHAPMGVYAIMGNHDYGDYSYWPSAEAREKNLTDLYSAYDAMDIELLLNRTVWLRSAQGDSIAVIGVENIGEPPFSAYGSLHEAYPHISDSATKILLTHNPRHWTDSIRPDATANVALTLSGHTHAMQMEIAGHSLSALRYDTWGGLYSDPQGRRFIYVNIGCGTVGLPLRIGATPEITIITLRRSPVSSSR